MLIGVLVLVQLSASAQTRDNRSQYIGYEFDNVLPDTLLPNGVRYLGGGLIGDIDADPVFSISEHVKGKTKMIWLKNSTSKDETGVKGWRVLDVLAFPNLAAADYLFFYGDPGIHCTESGTEIENLVGVGRIQRRQGIFKPTKLWIANLTAKKFEPRSLTKVRCVYSEP